ATPTQQSGPVCQYHRRCAFQMGADPIKLKTIIVHHCPIRQAIEAGDFSDDGIGKLDQIAVLESLATGGAEGGLPEGFKGVLTLRANAIADVAEVVAGGSE
ncbi:hypothetical protein RZS08_48655, partial [Arthrospira platensis SPKY1]|nr:hypothetical protein [Arthrospira platensis SPKY1]